MTFGASRLRRREGSRRTPSAHTVGGASPDRGARGSTGARRAIPAGRERSARGLIRAESPFSRRRRLRSATWAAPCVSSLSPFDAGGEGGVVNHFPARCSQRSSGPVPIGSLNASSRSFPTRTKKAPQLAPQLAPRLAPRPGAGSFCAAAAAGGYSSRRYADDHSENRFDPGFDDDDDDACVFKLRRSGLGCPDVGGQVRERNAPPAWWFRAVRRTTTRWW